MRGRFTLLAVLALGIGAAPANATPEDVLATHTYIEANYVLAQAMVARIGAGQAKIEHLDNDLAHECPGVGTGSPEDEASQPISHEVVVALWSLAYGVDARPVHTFTNIVGRLRWSSHAIRRAAQTYDRNLQELATVPLPDLCVDVRSWKESGFQTVPAAIVSRVLRVEAIEPKAISPRLLAPYERGADASIIARTIRLEQRIEEYEFLVGQGNWIQVLETLGLQE
jgi:hypothetical protein